MIGDAGRVVPEGDVAALAAVIRELEADQALRVETGLKGRARALGAFTQTRVADDTVAFYQRLLGARPASATLGSTGAAG